VLISAQRADGACCRLSRSPLIQTLLKNKIPVFKEGDIAQEIGLIIRKMFPVLESAHCWAASWGHAGQGRRGTGP